MSRPLTEREFDRAMDRAICPGGGHARPRLIVHSPGFFTEGPTFGVGFSTIACPSCSEDVTNLVTLQYGGYGVRSLG